MTPVIATILVSDVNSVAQSSGSSRAM